MRPLLLVITISLIFTNILVTADPRSTQTRKSSWFAAPLRLQVRRCHFEALCIFSERHTAIQAGLVDLHCYAFIINLNPISSMTLPLIRLLFHDIRLDLRHMVMTKPKIVKPYCVTCQKDADGSLHLTTLNE